MLLDVYHRPLEKPPCVFLLGIFALGWWLLTGGCSISLGVQDDDKQMVCCNVCLGCWCGDTMALVENDRRREGGGVLDRW